MKENLVCLLLTFIELNSKSKGPESEILENCFNQANLLKYLCSMGENNKQLCLVIIAKSKQLQ